MTINKTIAITITITIPIGIAITIAIATVAVITITVAITTSKAIKFVSEGKFQSRDMDVLISSRVFAFTVNGSKNEWCRWHKWKQLRLKILTTSYWFYFIYSPGNRLFPLSCVQDSSSFSVGAWQGRWQRPPQGQEPQRQPHTPQQLCTRYGVQLSELRHPLWHTKQKTTILQLF